MKMNLKTIRIVMNDLYAVEDAVNDAVDCFKLPDRSEKTMVKGELKLSLERWFESRKKLVLEYDPATDTLIVVEVGK